MLGWGGEGKGPRADRGNSSVFPPASHRRLHGPWPQALTSVPLPSLSQRHQPPEAPSLSFPNTCGLRGGTWVLCVSTRHVHKEHVLPQLRKTLSLLSDASWTGASLAGWEWARWGPRSLSPSPESSWVSWAWVGPVPVPSPAGGQPRGHIPAEIKPHSSFPGCQGRQSRRQLRHHRVKWQQLVPKEGLRGGLRGASGPGPLEAVSESE